MDIYFPQRVGMVFQEWCLSKRSYYPNLFAIYLSISSAEVPQARFIDQILQQFSIFFAASQAYEVFYYLYGEEKVELISRIGQEF